MTRSRTNNSDNSYTTPMKERESKAAKQPKEMYFNNEETLKQEQTSANYRKAKHIQYKLLNNSLKIR